MERNTLTQLGNLGKGDRFTYPGKKDVWQVIDFGANKKYINQVENGNRLHLHDTVKPNTTAVVFLRHTVAQPENKHQNAN